MLLIDATTVLDTHINKMKNTHLPFLINKLVTRLRASRGDLLKKFGDKFGGSVNGFRLPPVPVSHARIDPWGCIRSKFSVDAGRGWRCFGYQPLAGPPDIRNISLLANA